MNDDFTGPALAAGTVLGVRAFDIDNLGRLRGVTHADVFRPGENIARCRATPQGRWAHVPGGMTWAMDEPREHHPGSADCECGYWAHYDGTHSYETKLRASAIIEGYGLVTLGTSGFRAGKARLVALVPPSHLPVAARVADLYGAAGVPIYRTPRGRAHRASRDASAPRPPSAPGHTPGLLGPRRPAPSGLGHAPASPDAGGHQPGADVVAVGRQWRSHRQP